VLALASLCWSGNHIMGGRSPGHVPPLAIANLALAARAAVLWPFVRHQVARDWPLMPAEAGVILFLALIAGSVRHAAAIAAPMMWLPDQHKLASASTR